jgi:hypothetical protein
MPQAVRPPAGPVLPVPRPPPDQDLRPALAVHHARRRPPAGPHAQRRHPDRRTAGLGHRPRADPPWLDGIAAPDPLTR